MADTVDLQRYNLTDFGFGQRQEHDSLVNTVEELGPYGFLQHVHYFSLGFFDNLLLVAAVQFLHLALDVGTAHVGGHDDDGVLEVHRPAFVVGQTSVIEYLQQDVEYIGMSFLDFIE